MSEVEFILVLLVMIFGLVIAILSLVIWNQNRQIEELEILYMRLADTCLKDGDQDDHGVGDNGMDISRSLDGGSGVGSD